MQQLYTYYEYIYLIKYMYKEKTEYNNIYIALSLSHETTDAYLKSWYVNLRQSTIFPTSDDLWFINAGDAKLKRCCELWP